MTPARWAKAYDEGEVFIIKGKRGRAFIAVKPKGAKRPEIHWILKKSVRMFKRSFYSLGPAINKEIAAVVDLELRKLAGSEAFK